MHKKNPRSRSSKDTLDLYTPSVVVDDLYKVNLSLSMRR